MTHPIGLIAAMPEETKPLLRQVGTVTATRFGGFRGYLFSRGGHDVCLIESGIGAGKAREATKILIDEAAPRIILNFGFGGAVLPGPAVGDIVVAESLLFFNEGELSEQTGLVSGLGPEVALLSGQDFRKEGFHIHCGTFVTTGEIVGKQALAQILPYTAKNPVLEMESAAVAQTASEQNVPFAALRAISDGAGEHLEFSIADIADSEMRIRVWKVLLTLVRTPRILPQLVRLGKNSKVAADHLAMAVLAFIDRI